MAVNKTGAMFKSLTFDGEDSRNYGVYITGQAVFNAPEREVEMISIPGRNGQFALDKGRFENIEVTYPAGIFANTEAEFAEAVSNFRNLLCSKRGYVRLQDEYHPEEYRMAIYKSGLELENVALKAGEFEITFDCKPQRWLTSGEEEITIGGAGDTETVTGDTIQIDNPEGNLEVQSLSVSLAPTQSGTGTPSPTNIRPISGYDTVNVIVSPTQSALDGNTYTTTLPDTVYNGTLDVVNGVLTVEYIKKTITSFTSQDGQTANGYCAYAVLSDTNRSTNLINADMMVSNMFTYTTSGRNSAPLYSYGGNNGGTSYQAFILPSSVTSLAEANTWLSNLTEPLECTFRLATPITYQLTAQSIELLQGNNNVWSDGTITLSYIEDLSKISNPTLFDAEPLLEVEGYGTIGFNGYEIELANGNVGTIQLASQTFSGEKTFTFDQSLLNSGDTITLNGTAVYTSTSDVSSATNSNSAYSSTVSGRTVTTSFSLTLSKGTDFTSSNTLTIVRAGYPVDFTSQILYTSSGDTGALSFSTSLITETSWTWSFDAVGDSTVWRLGNPTYIDCELGECYKYNGTEIISLNSYIDLGSDLPKLAPGGNEFTIDNTITELKVVPKWWKV